MTTSLFDMDYNLDRIADALEGLLALARAHVTPAAATAAPADRDSVQQAFDAKMGDPLQALGNLTAVAVPAAEPAPSPRPWTHWAKVDPRSRELAKLRTGAEKREKAAKTTATRDAAKADKNAYLNESKARQKRLRAWLDAGKGIIDGDALYYFDAAGTKIKWVPSPTPHFYLPNS
jgi:hypothetical protein